MKKYIIVFLTVLSVFAISAASTVFSAGYSTVVTLEVEETTYQETTVSETYSAPTEITESETGTVTNDSTSILTGVRTEPVIFIIIAAILITSAVIIYRMESKE